MAYRQRFSVSWLMQCKLTLFRGHVAFSSAQWGGWLTCFRLRVQLKQSCKCQTGPRIEPPALQQYEMLAFMLLASPLFPQREGERIPRHAAGKASGIIIGCFIPADSSGVGRTRLSAACTRQGGGESIRNRDAENKTRSTSEPRINTVQQNMHCLASSWALFFDFVRCRRSSGPFFQGFLGAFIFLAD